jgi:mRNA interferase MazF
MICGLEKESIVLCHQIRTIDKKRLSKHYGHLAEESIQHEIIEAIKFQLGIG